MLIQDKPTWPIEALRGISNYISTFLTLCILKPISIVEICARYFHFNILKLDFHQLHSKYTEVSDQNDNVYRREALTSGNRLHRK